MHLHISVSLWTVSEGAKGYVTNPDTKAILLYGSVSVLEGLYIQGKKKGRSLTSVFFTNIVKMAFFFL